MKSRRREGPSTLTTVVFSFCTALLLFALLRSFVSDPAEKVVATPPAPPVEIAKPIVILSEVKADPQPVQEAPPVAPVVEATEQKHTVKDKETLSSISKKYYGTETKWEKIWEANKTTIPNKNKIRPGITLIIPEKA